MVAPLAVSVSETGAQDADGAGTLDGAPGALGGVGEAVAVPAEAAWRARGVSPSVCLTNRSRAWEIHTVLVADVVVQVDLGLNPLAVNALEGSAEHVVVLKTDVAGGVEERHGECVCVCGWLFGKMVDGVM